MREQLQEMGQLNEEIIEGDRLEKEVLEIAEGTNENDIKAEENLDETKSEVGTDLENNKNEEKDVSEEKKTKSKDKNKDIFEEENGLMKAGKRKKKEIYKDKQIISIGELPAVASIGERKQKAYIELLTSLKTKTSLKGIISSSREIAGHLTAIILYGDIQVLIPVEKLAVFDITIHGSEREQTTFKRMLVNQRLGAEIEFIVEVLDEVQRLAIGNRVMALNRKKRDYFLTKDRSGNFKINEGDIAEARIVYTAQDRIGIELFGYECDLRQKDISYNRIADVTQEYEPGDIIAVKVKKIERTIVTIDGKPKWDFKCIVSAKEAQPDPRKEYFYYYPEGSSSIADVTQIDEHGIYVRLEGKNGKMDALIPFGNNTQIDPSITKGTSLLVQITHTDAENLFLYARVVRIIKKAN